jgi:hypothetical protein
MTRIRAAAAALLLSSTFLAGPPARALESDQYFAWGREIEDSTDVLNAKVTLEIERVLAEINAGRGWRRKSCDDVVEEIVSRFRQFIFQDFELWATKTTLVDRVPRTPEEELEYRERYLYHNTHFFDLGTKIPPSPTIEIDGVRLGTDKLSHFFAEGWWYFKWYRSSRESGSDVEEAERRAIRLGIVWEKTILGLLASGVFSPGDLEANFQGMRFLVGLCEGDAPGLRRTEEGWRYAGRFDFRDHVSPEWDESWQPPAFGKQRWKKVRPALIAYCPLLSDPRVSLQRRAYAARDRTTPTERELRALVEAGKLPDPAAFALDAHCPGNGPTHAVSAFRGPD